MAFLRFEELDVFKLAEQLADDVWDIVLSWKYFEKDTVGRQFVRAADSIGANISEGAGRGSQKDNQRFVRISRGSLNETKFWVRRAKKRSLITEDQSIAITKIIDELGPRLNAYLKSIGRTQTNSFP
ncbi:MAG: four helix bundle protein [Deltaproteobacteria bacterium]|nr:four helix bundle protein [Deltaproteobacteria bacterium]